jgi:hypothetical protein
LTQRETWDVQELKCGETEHVDMISQSKVAFYSQLFHVCKDSTYHEQRSTTWQTYVYAGHPLGFYWE